MAENLVRACGQQAVRFITIGIADRGAPLVKNLRKLLASFNKLRHSQLWKNHVTGGAYAIQITRGKNGDHWHVHLHALVVGLFIDQRQLSDAWRRASGGSYVVDVRAVRNLDETVDYVARYAARGFDQCVYRDRDALQEAVSAIRGSKFVSTFGSWRGLALYEKKKSTAEWRSVGKLVDVINAARRGEIWARGVLQSIGLNVDEVCGRQYLTRRSSAPSTAAGLELSRDTEPIK